MTLIAGMRTLLIRIVLATALLVGLAAAPAAALAAPMAPAPPAAIHALPQASDDEHDVLPVTIWALVGTLIGALVLGILYLFKRRVGGFPTNPDWVAPISIERSETFPKEGDYGDIAPGSHGAHH